jgi:hypothetical protein
MRDELIPFLLVVDDARLGHRLERPGERALRAPRAAREAALLAAVARQEGDDAVRLAQRVRAEDERVRGVEAHGRIFSRDVSRKR